MKTPDLYKIYCEHPETCTDSRDIKPQCVFYALKGAHFDGNSFALQAIEKGAAYAVVDSADVPEHKQLIRVSNVLESLQSLANHHRRKLGIPIIGITGTNGKTTTKELVAQVLSTSYRIGVTKGNLNNHIGVPLTLLKMNKQTQIGVVEMGANHPGEIATLCRIAEPNYGLITNVGKAHLEGFGSLEGVKKAKGELYDFLSSVAGKIFYNSDDSTLQEMISARHITQAIPYGKTKDEVKTSINQQVFLHLTFSDNTTIQTQLIGDYNTNNILASLAVGRFFDIPLQKAKAAIGAYVPNNNRSQLIRSSSNTIIMDAYNANPTSMRVAIENFAQMSVPDKWVILGDMKELGNETAAEHYAIFRLLHDKQIEHIILVGESFREAAKNEKALCFENVDDLIVYLKNHPLRNATVLVKGSHSLGLEKLAAHL